MLSGGGKINVNTYCKIPTVRVPLYFNGTLLGAMTNLRTYLLTLLMGIKEILQGPRVCTDFMQEVDEN